MVAPSEPELNITPEKKKKKITTCILIIQIENHAYASYQSTPHLILQADFHLPKSAVYFASVIVIALWFVLTRVIIRGLMI